MRAFNNKTQLQSLPKPWEVKIIGLTTMSINNFQSPECSHSAFFEISQDHRQVFGALKRYANTNPGQDATSESFLGRSGAQSTKGCGGVQQRLRAIPCLAKVSNDSNVSFI